MKVLWIFCIATVFFACEEKDLELTSNPIDFQIFIETREVLEADSRRAILLCKTEKIYPCVNFSLLTEENIDKNSLELNFTSVGETRLCATALGPATTSIDLNTLTVGEYDIQLNNGSLTNEGTLKITDKDISLFFQYERGIELVRPTINRVPPNTYWGTIGYHTSSSIIVVNEFLQKLTAIGAEFSKQKPGHYFYYEIDINGDIITNTENSGYYFKKAFIFQFDGDESELKSLIRNDGKNYKTELSINVESYKGEQINNWTD